MWSLWFFPLVGLAFLGGLGLAIGWFFFARPRTLARQSALILIPVCAAGLPIAGLLALAALEAAAQPSDAELYEEIYAQKTTMRDDQMLFDDFGRGVDRSIYMRAEPTPGQRGEILPDGVVELSPLTQEDFANFGDDFALGWWLNDRDSVLPGTCSEAKIYRADGYRGWREFKIAECLTSGEFYEARPDGRLYVMARGR